MEELAGAGIIKMLGSRVASAADSLHGGAAVSAEELAGKDIIGAGAAG